MKKLILALVASGVFGALAVVARKLPPMNVVEGESVSIESLNAKVVRSANTAVFSAALRESGEAVVTGTRLGTAQLDFVDDRGVFATRTVSIVPPYWDMLCKMFAEDPEIMIEIMGDKVVISGATANVETLRRVDQAKALDGQRIVAQVTYSTAQIGELVADFLARAAISNITVNVVGREVCLAGRLYDQQSIEQLKKRVTNFLHDFPSISVNTDGLRIFKQKIVIGIEFLQYDTTMAKNLGFAGPETITGAIDFDFGYDWAKGNTRTREAARTADNTLTYGNQSASGEGGGTGAGTPTTTFSNTRGNTLSDGKNSTLSHNWQAGMGAKVTGVEATINLLKKNAAARTLYTTSLTTQSGVEAQFQNGGTVHAQTSNLYNSDLKDIEYGYIIKATPLIIDANTVNLDFDLNVKEYTGADPKTGSYDLPCYATKSKYIVRPGESIVLSGFKAIKDDQTKRGTPWLSNIPWLGEKLFGNTVDNSSENERILVVTVNWAVEDDTANARKSVEDFKARPATVEMP